MEQFTYQIGIEEDEARLDKWMSSALTDLSRSYIQKCIKDGKVFVNASGSPAMAKGGSGDVLTGIIAGLLALGMDECEAASLGVYVHGLAGDIAAEEKGEIGVTSSDIIDALPAAWKKLTETKSRFTKE